MFKDEDEGGEDDEDGLDEEDDKDDIRMDLFSNFWQSSVLDSATAAAAHGWDNFDIPSGSYMPILIMMILVKLCDPNDDKIDRRSNGNAC